MKVEDLLHGMNYVNSSYIEEAEAVTRLLPKKKLLSLRRPVLVAALIAVLLMLVGCAVVYMLNMQGLKLGDQIASRDIYEYDPNTGEAITHIGSETYTQQVLTLAGLNGTTASNAAREWYAFCESYDPDRAIQRSVWGSYPEFPAEYAGYGLYTQEMKDKLDEILVKYDLKLRGERIDFQTGKQLLRALGVENILTPGSEADLHISHTAYYENGHLDVYFDIALPGEGGASDVTNAYLFYRPKDCFIPDTVVLTDVPWEEWNYTTTAGDNVLIIRSEDAASAWIFCDMQTCTATVRVDVVKQMAVAQKDNKQIPQFAVMSKAQLEQLANSIDFSLEPKLVDGWETLPDNAVSAGQQINGYRIEPVSAFTDGYGYQIILRITAPEGIALTDPDDHTARVEAGAGTYGRCTEDGDGKLNTCHIILSEHLSRSECPEDGTYPYPEGNVIPIYWEDLYFTRYDFEKQESIVTLLTEGTWKFNVPLSTADTREIELLTEPISAKACVAWKLDGTDVLEDREVTSVKLRSLGIDLVSPNAEPGNDFFCFTGQFSYIVMKDGTWVEFTYGSLNDPIDLDQVAYVQLADRTILPMPGVDAETVSFLCEMVQQQWDAAYVPMPVFEGGVELLTEPIRMSHLAGYVTDSTGDREPLYEYVPITSIILHPDGLAIVGPSAFDSADSQATVFLKDGSKILLTGMGGSPYCDEPMSQLKAETAIDLSQAVRILLPDGTELPIPAVS